MNQAISKEVKPESSASFLSHAVRTLVMNRSRIPWAPVVVHSTRTAVAAVVSVAVAQFFRLPETYWAPLTTLVITQSSLGAAWSVSKERFIGTLLGAAVGAIVASRFGPHLLVFGTCVFILGLLSAALHSNRSAYRFAGVTVAIVLLVPHTESGWLIALHRFAEVCIGIGVALILALVWPEGEETALAETKSLNSAGASSGL